MGERAGMGGEGEVVSEGLSVALRAKQKLQLWSSQPPTRPAFATGPAGPSPLSSPAEASRSSLCP